MPLEYYFYYVYYSFLGMPFILRVSSLALTFFIPLYFLSAFVFFKYRRSYNNTKKSQERLRIKYKEKIRSVIVSEKHLTINDLDNLFDRKIKKLSKRDKRILSRKIPLIYEDTEFINYENNQTLLDYLNIRQFWEKQLMHGNIMQKHDSLRRFDDLHTKVSGAVLTGLTYDRDEFLRKRSRSSYLRSTPNDPFRFFDDDFDKVLNSWDRIDLHNALEKRSKRGELPNLARWLHHAHNLSFQCFLVDEIAFFNQQENVVILTELIKEEETDSLLRIHCINALAKMNFQQIEPDLVKIYNMQPLHVQDAIIQAVGKLLTGKSLPFLIKIYQDAVDDERRLMILSVMYNYGEAGREWFYTEKDKQKKTDFSYLIFNHVSNPLLSI